MPAINIAEPSVKSLLIQLRYSGQPLATGTGFVVQTTKGPALLTNRHNVTGRHQDSGELLSKSGAIPNEIVVTHNRQGKLGQWMNKTESLVAGDGTPLWIEHPKLGATKPC